MEITLGDYVHIDLESIEALKDAKSFLMQRSYKEAFCNFGSEIAYSIDMYEACNYVKVSKSIKLRELALDNRMDFLNLINNSNQYNKYEIDDVLELFNTKSGLFLYEKEYVGSYTMKDDIVYNIYSKIKLDEYIQKLINKHECLKVLCNSNDNKLKDTLNKLGFIKKETIKTYYKI